MEFGVWSLEFLVFSLESGVWSLEFGVGGLWVAVWSFDWGGVGFGKFKECLKCLTNPDAGIV